MQMIAGLIGLTFLALACALLVALYDDKMALRLSAILIARREGRVAYRARHAEVLAEKEREFGLQAMPWQATREERG